MNQIARDILIQAARDGHPQAFRKLHDAAGGDCALGVLHLEMHATRDEAIACRKPSLCLRKISTIFGLYPFRCPTCLRANVGVIHMNDKHKLNFLEIAYKVPLSTESRW